MNRIEDPNYPESQEEWEESERLRKEVEDETKNKK